jgi:hypothetical protein
MNRYVVSAVALMASAGIAFAQSPKGQEASPPSAKSAPSGQTNSDGASGSNSAGSSKSVAPSQTKDQGSSASDEAPGRTKAQDNVGGTEKGSEDGKAKSKRAQTRDDATKSKRSKNADQNETDKGKRSTTAPRQDDTKRQGDATRQRDTTKQVGKSGNEKGGSSAQINLNQEQKTKVVTTFKKHRVAPAKDIHIDVSVGTVVPRKVTLHPIPRDILVIAPAYKRYKYFVVEDRVIIVEPATHEIVDVLILA